MPSVLVNSSQRIFFPVEQACSLASPVRVPIATSLEMDGTAQSARMEIFCRVITVFMRNFVNAKSLAAESQHLRHKWHRVQTALAIEGPKNFFLAANLHPIADFQFFLGRHFCWCALFLLDGQGVRC